MRGSEKGVFDTAVFFRPHLHDRQPGNPAVLCVRNSRHFYCLHCCLHCCGSRTLSAAESVIVGPQGQLVMLDRYNHLWEASQDGKAGQWVLSPEPLAKLGPGRPLGYHFDHDGNLIVCDSLKVC